jgi:hypothetical protein
MASPPRAKTETNIGTNAPLAKPSPVTAGRIDSVRLKASYVVISFPIGAVPPVGTRLNVYRQGSKVAEVIITMPQENNLTAGDILAGQCQIGDEVRF